MPRKPTTKPADTEPEVLAAPDDAQAARVADANARIDKTIGEHVAEAQSRPSKIPWPHDVGSHVLLLTDGHPSKKARLRNIHDHGGYAHYSLVLEDGGEINDVEAWRIGRDIDAEGELAQLRERLALEARHRERGREMAQKHFEMEAEDRRLAEVHAAHRTSMRALAAKLAEHVRTDPGQTDLRDIVGEEKPEYPIPEGMNPNLAIADRIRAGDVVELADLLVSFDQLRAARIDQGTASTGKPQQVKPVTVLEHEYLLADVQQGIAVLLPVLTKDEWAAAMVEKFGPPRDLPSDYNHGLAMGGRLNGCPVKVGRSTRYLGDEASALLIRVPAELAAAAADEPPASGKDAAAGG